MRNSRLGLVVVALGTFLGVSVAERVNDFETVQFCI